MNPAGMGPCTDRTCDGCEHSHLDVWWTVNPRGRFRAYCQRCWAHYVGVYS